MPGVTSSYRRIPDAGGEGSLGSWEGDGELKGLRRQVPLLKLAFLDSGVEMAVGDSSLATSPRLSQDSLDLEPVGSPEPLALPMEPSAHLGRLLASQKLERALERSSQLPTSPAGLSQHHRSLKPTRRPEYEVPPFGARDQGATKAETDPEAGLEEAEVVSAISQAGWRVDGDGPFMGGCWGSPFVLPGALSGWGISVPNDGLFHSSWPHPTPSCVEVGRYEVCLTPWLAGHWEASWVHDPPFPACSAPI